MEQLKKYSPLFVFQLAFVVLMYWPTAGAGFVTDEIGWFTTYNQLDWGGLLHAFNDKSFHFVYHLFGFAFWKLLGFNGNAWMVAISSLHALNATLLFVAFNKLFEAWMPGFAHQAALASSFLFLISPYHTEPLVWYACVHYTVCGGLLLSSLILLLKYLERQKKASLLYFYVPFGIACFTLELSFTWPFVFGLIVLFAPNDERSVTDRIKLTLRIAAPTLGMVILYFAVNKFLRGSFVGHYGASTHLNADPILLGSNLAKYAAKLFGLTQFLPYERRDVLYHFFEQKHIAYTTVFVVFSVCGALVLSIKNSKSFLVLLAVLLVGWLLALAPVVNLFFSHIVNVEGDRLTYTATIFSSAVIAVFVFRLMKNYAWLAIVPIMAVNLILLGKNIARWHGSLTLQQSMMESFKWYDANKIYFLNMPDNYSGAYMYRSFAPDNSFAETLMLRTGKDIEHKVKDVMYWNINDIAEGVQVQVVNDSTLQVTLNQWGNWWWKDGKGCTDNQTQLFTAVADEWGHSYTLTLKDKKPGSVFLYLSNGVWNKVEGF